MMLHTLRGLLRKRVLTFLISTGVLIVSPFALADIISGTSTSGISDHVTYTQLTLNTPSVSAGDVMIASIAVSDGSSDNVTPPAGWTPLAETDNDVNVKLVSYWKVAGAQEPSNYTWLIDAQTRAVGGITPYSGVDSTSPIDAVASDTGFGSTATTTAITTNGANEEVVSLFATNVGKSFSTRAGMNQKYNLQHDSEGPSTAAFDTLQVSAGSTGSVASTIDANKARYWATQQIALRRLSPPISYNSGSGAWQQNGTGDQTMPVTLSADDNFLVVGVENGNGQGDTVTGVTWNGTPMMPLGKVGATGQFGYYTYLYGLINPATGTHNVVTQGAVGGPFVFAAGYKGVSALPTNVTTQTLNGSAITSISYSITTSAANAWVIGFGDQNSNCGNSWNGMVSRVNSDCVAHSLGDTNGPVSAGFNTFTWGGAVSSNWNLMLMEVDPIQ